MSATTKIQWTDRTWNPVRGCSLVSAGCANCYAMKQAHRFSGMGRPYENLTEVGPKGPRWNGNIMLVPEELKAPLVWKKPCRVFVNSMSDLFHEDVPDSFIDQVMRAMANTKRHTYQVLTKRPARMLAYLSGWWKRCYQDFETGEYIPVNPCPHIWFGVSVENQETADERIPLLLQTPAAVRFVSAEPLLSPINLSQWLKGGHDNDDKRYAGVSFGGDRSITSGTGRIDMEGKSQGRHGAGERISATTVHCGRETLQSGSASGRMDGKQKTIHPSSHGDQSQGWEQEQELSRQSRTGDAHWEYYSQFQKAGSQTQGATRREEHICEIDRASGVGDQEPVGRSGNDTEGSRREIRYFPTQRVGDLSSQNVEARALISWLIVGGESGPGARPCDLSWIRSVKNQCKQADVPVFIKQLGKSPYAVCGQCGRSVGYVLGGLVDACGHTHAKLIAEMAKLKDRKGGNCDEWPEDLMVREFP